MAGDPPSPRGALALWAFSAEAVPGQPCWCPPGLGGGALGGSHPAEGHLLLPTCPVCLARPPLQAGGENVGVAGDQGKWGHGSDSPLPVQSQSWQWVSGDKYSATSGLARNGAHEGNCGMLTHSSGESPDHASASSTWSGILPTPLPPPPPAPLGLVPHGELRQAELVPLSSLWHPLTPNLSLQQASLCGPVPTAPSSITTSAGSLPQPEHGPLGDFREDPRQAMLLPWHLYSSLPSP